MKAVVWHGSEDVRVDDVTDPRLQEPTDAIIRVTSTAICGSDLHLYGGKVIKLEEGDILGHEPMGVVEEVGAAVQHISPGDRVVVPFNISCGACFMCDQGPFSQCETTQVREHGKGAALFGYTHLYGGVPGGQAEYLRVPQAQFGTAAARPGARRCGRSRRADFFAAALRSTPRPRPAAARAIRVRTTGRVPAHARVSGAACARQASA
jgi:threonine dehydrogenase-like Zn-dependent dehydrogenase